MRHRWLFVSLIAGVAVAAPSALSAQDWPQASKGKFQQRVEPQQDVEELTPGQIKRAQQPDRPAAGNSTTNAATTTAPAKPAAPKASTQAPPQPGRAVACSGAFAKNSSHMG